MTKSKNIQKAERESLNVRGKLLETLKASTPEVFVEDKINWDKLRLTLGEYLETSTDKFNFTWAGKAQAVTNVLIPSKATLKPDKRESIRFDESENLFIEGDNLEVIKLIQKAYFERIKMIYIDPPYNMGTDRIYKDDFRNSIQSYLEQTGQSDKEGNLLQTNSETSGRFHSDWLNMMYPRLKLSWNLLKHDGIIFISIGDKELHHLRMLMNEVFGEEHFIAIISRVTKKGGNAGDFFAPSIDYVVAYAKDKEVARNFREELGIDDIDRIYPEKDKDGPYYWRNFYESALDLERSSNARYYIEAPDGEEIIPPEGHRWRRVETSFLEEKEKLKIIKFERDDNSPHLDKNGKQSKWQVYYKLRPKPYVPDNVFVYIEDAVNALGTNALTALGIDFEFSKPPQLIKRLCNLCIPKKEKDKGHIIMDFFAGSGTLAQSVLEQNKQDGGNRRFILIQLPELTNPKCEAYKQGYKNIANICKERVRRVINGYKKYQPCGDGFKVFKLDKSNYIENQFECDSDKSAEENDKIFKNYLSKAQKELFPARINELDIVYENIIKEGLNLNAKIKEVVIGKSTAYKVSDIERELYISLDEKLNTSAIEALTDKEYKEKIFICIDGALGDSDKANLALNVTLKTI